MADPPAIYAVTVLGIGSGSGKTVVSSGILRMLTDAGTRALPFKAVSEGIAPGRSDTAALHAAACCRSLPAQCYPITSVVSRDGARAHLWSASDARPLPVVRIADDTVYWDALTPSGLDLLRARLDDALAAVGRSCDLVVVEGSGSVSDTVADLSNSYVARLTTGPVLLVANIRRSGFVAGLVGTARLLDDEIAGRVDGVVLTNVPAAVRGDDVSAHVRRRTGLDVVGVVGHVAGWGVPQPTQGAFAELSRDLAGTTARLAARCGGVPS